MSSQIALKTVWILISWLLQKPTDLDLQCLRGIILFSKSVICLSTVYTILQVKFSLDKYIKDCFHNHAGVKSEINAISCKLYTCMCGSLTIQIYSRV